MNSHIAKPVDPEKIYAVLSELILSKNKEATFSSTCIRQMQAGLLKIGQYHGIFFEWPSKTVNRPKSEGGYYGK